MYNEKEHIESEFMRERGASPFRVPEGYFDSFDDRIMKRLEVDGGKKRRSVNLVRILKPIVTVAASIVLVYIVANTKFTRQDVSKELAASVTNATKDDSTFNFSLIDESTLVNTIFSEDKSNPSEVNSEDMLAYLSSGLNEVQICTAIQNK
ncbi:MAG TPA: hypothetical protein PLG33_02355 [Prolixibacteraceae bacterium]|nr:hypothetical protein [Prolixibacteraceae bacterium]HPR84862.1 hypothetical protein [Prolixibacteraceae bacterium]